MWCLKFNVQNIRSNDLPISSNLSHGFFIALFTTMVELSFVIVFAHPVGYVLVHHKVYFYFGVLFM